MMMMTAPPLSTLPVHEAEDHATTTTHRCPCTKNKKKRKYKKRILRLLRRTSRCSKHTHKLLAVAEETQTETEQESSVAFTSTDVINNHHHEHVVDSDDDSVSLCSCVHALEEEEEEDGPPATTTILKHKTQQESLSQSFYTTTPDNPFDCCHCASASASANAPSKKTSVGFSTVTIQSYNTVLSDNPCPLEGPAVELGWEQSQPPVQLTVDLHHKFTNPWKQQAKYSNCAFHLSGYTRQHRLLQAGYTSPQLAKATQEAAKARSSRQRNATGCPQWLMHIFGFATDDSCPACSSSAPGQVYHPNHRNRKKQKQQRKADCKKGGSAN